MAKHNRIISLIMLISVMISDINFTAMALSEYGLREEAFFDNVTGNEIKIVGMDGAHTLHGYHTSQDTSDDGERIALSMLRDENYKDGVSYFDDFSLNTEGDTGLNMFENPSFESGESKWSNLDTSKYSITNSEAYTGDKSLKLTGTATASQNYFIYKNSYLIVEPGTSYVFSFRYKVDWPAGVAVDHNKTARVQLRANPGNVVLVDSRKGSGDNYGTSGEGLKIDGEWHEFTAVFSSKPKGIEERTEFSQIGVRDTNTQNGAIYYFDDFSLRPLLKGELSVSGFENNEVTPFFIDQNAAGSLTISNMEYYSGSHSLKFETANEDKSLYLPSIPVEKNTEYELSFFYKANESGVVVRVFDGADYWFGSGTQLFSETLQGTGGAWQKFTKKFNSSDKSVITLRIRCSQSGRIYYFDDFSLKKTMDINSEIMLNNNKIEGNVHISNNSGTEMAVFTVMAAYEKDDGRLFLFDYDSLGVENGQASNILLELPDTALSCNIKLFVFDNNLSPYILQKEFNPTALLGIENGGFENNISSWEAVGDQNKFSISISEQKSGLNSLKLTADTNSGMIKKKIATSKNTAYTLSFYAKSNNSGSRVGLYDKLGRFIGEISTDNDFIWKKYDISFDSRDNDEIEIRILKGLKPMLTDDISSMSSDLVFYDTVSKNSYFIDRVDEAGTGTSGGDQHFYRKNGKTYSFSMADYPYEKRLVSDMILISPYSVTLDGTVLGGGHGSFTGNGPRLVRIDTASGEYENLHDPIFPTQPFNIFNHAIINPINPDILYYSHGGIDLRPEQYLPGDGPGDGRDIMWIYNDSAAGQKEKLLYNQKMVGGVNSEWISHVVFSADGEGVYGVKIPIQNGSPPNGIIYAPLSGIPSGEELTYINSDYRYLHVAASPDGRYLVADTDPNHSGDKDGNYKIVLIDLKTKKSTLLAQFHYDLSHNGQAHAHPTFSNNSDKVIFSIDIGGYIWTAYIHI